MEKEAVGIVKYGQYTIFNVPIILLDKPTPTGEYTIRHADVDYKVSEICEHMERHNLREFDYQDF